MSGRTTALFSISAIHIGRSPRRSFSISTPQLAMDTSKCLTANDALVCPGCGNRALGAGGRGAKCNIQACEERRTLSDILTFLTQ